MSKPKHRIIFICQECGKESPKWLGRCPSCQAWNSFVETPIGLPGASAEWRNLTESAPQELSQVELQASPRLKLYFSELNRVLGGGLVPGSLVLVSGEPGIGKSTLLLQVAATAPESERAVIYVSGEESVYQVKLRSERLGLKREKLYLLSETNLEIVLEQLEKLSPSMVIVDSIQAVCVEGTAGISGSITQIRESTLRLMNWAKRTGVPVLITGHVTKEGAIAGPKALEHIVDVVLYFEGEPFSNYRVLRSVKNRFGSTSEIAVFEMGDGGLAEVENPSRAFLSQRSDVAVGSVVVPTLGGSRPLLVEIQALTTLTSFTSPRRVANGVDFGRLLLIIAVLAKRSRINLSNQDIVVNVTGGLKVDEPAADLGIALAIASSFRDIGVVPELVALGEVGLSGELRPVPQLERRIAEAVRLGFKRCLVPAISAKSLVGSIDVQLIEVNTVAEALRLGLVKGVG